MTWAFSLEPIGKDATHLITRVRMNAQPAWGEWLMGTVIGPPIHGLMQGTQLRHIKQLAEQEALSRVPEPITH